jgi:hypothetical protein
VTAAPVYPITPEEQIAKAKKFRIENCPPEVIQAVNEMLIEDGSSYVYIKQDTLVKRILLLMNANDCEERFTSRDVYDGKWLDFEEVFIAAGWDVVYDKPGYCETYAANWKFSRRTR